MLDAAKMLADARLDRRAKHLAAITPGVPIFVCRNLLILADQDAHEHFNRPALQKPGTTEATRQ